MDYDFSFISDSLTRTSLETMQVVLTEHNLMDYVKNFSGDSFMFADSDELTIIANDARNDFHSGASFGMTLRTFQYILINGIEDFKQQTIQDELNQKIYDNNEKFIETDYAKYINNI